MCYPLLPLLINHSLLPLVDLEDLAAYTLTVLKPFDPYHPNSYQSSGAGHCGTPGQLSGLQFTFSNTELPSIPYNQLVEVAFTVSGSELCSEYVDVELMIMSTCEMPSSNSEVFQYGTQRDPVTGQVSVTYDSAHVLRAANSTGKFTVRWPSTRRRRTSEMAQGAAADSHTADANPHAERLTEVELALRDVTAAHQSTQNTLAELTAAHQSTQNTFAELSKLLSLSLQSRSPHTEPKD